VPLVTVSNTQVWEFVRLLADFPTTNNTTPQLTGLKFTPAANSRYWIKAALLVSSSSVTAGVNVGASFPTGTTFVAARSQSSQSRNAADPGSRNYGALTPLSVSGSIAMDVALATYWARFEGTLATGATPVGDFEITLQVEPAVVATVTLHAGSTIQTWDYS
jgi:hypothetical protein